MPELQSPRWLITGATGFLGANLGTYLEGKARRVGAVRGTSAASQQFDEWVQSDLADPVAAARSTESARADVIVHAAALASHEQCEREPALAELINVTATRELAAAARRSGARFVLISTDAVFDGERGNYSETDTANPHSVYGKTKLAGEQAAVEVNPDSLIVRTNFFGWSPTGRRSILEFFVNNLSSGTSVRGFTDFTVTSLYAQALAQAIGDLAQAHADGIFHVAASDSMSKYEFGVAVAREFGLDEALITATASDMDPPRGQDQSLDVSKAEALLGRKLATTAEGIAMARQDANLRKAITNAAHP